MKDNWKTAFMRSLSVMSWNELASSVAPTLSTGTATTPQNFRSSFFFRPQVLQWGSISQRHPKTLDARQLEVPAIPQVAGIQVQTARCLSPVLPTEGCSQAPIIQRQSNTVADSFTRIQPVSISSCALPQHTTLSSLQDSGRTRDPCTCQDLAPNGICWWLHTGCSRKGSKKHFQDS